MIEDQPYSIVDPILLVKELTKALPKWEIRREILYSFTKLKGQLIPIITPEGVKFFLYPRDREILTREEDHYKPALPEEIITLKDLILYFQTPEFLYEAALGQLSRDGPIDGILRDSEAWLSNISLKKALTDYKPETPEYRTARDLLLGREISELDKKIFYNYLIKSAPPFNTIRIFWSALLLLRYSSDTD